MELSSALIDKICKKEKISKNQLVLHSDNGGPMKGATMLATLQDLGVIPSFSRPSVSDDNPFSESLFKTMKYCPEFPAGGFKSLAEAIEWVKRFVDWYNNDHLHSGIKFVTPSQRHEGLDKEILKNREKVYIDAKLMNPVRWSKKLKTLSGLQKFH
jgi:transposase InsO family protein